MKKLNFLSVISVLLGLVFTLFMPLLISLGAVIASYETNFPFNWKIAVVFLVLFNGWWYYVLYRGAMLKLAQSEADKKQKLDSLLKASDQ